MDIWNYGSMDVDGYMDLCILMWADIWVSVDWMDILDRYIGRIYWMDIWVSVDWSKCEKEEMILEVSIGLSMNEYEEN